jgi:hypothetical protein
VIDCNPLFMEMEVLTLLPPRGAAGYVLLRDMVEDLGTDGQRPIRDAIEILRQRHGIDVATFHSPVEKEGDAAAIEPGSWDKAEALAESYLRDGDWATEGQADG